MDKIYEPQFAYSLLRVWSEPTVRSLFSRVRIEGRESVPTDGVVLLAPNHCNTLMDALLVQQGFPRQIVLFGARADIFRKPRQDRFLRFLRILPIPRVRDGLQEVVHNRETMDQVVEALDHGVPYCLFCEGTHRTKHSLLPLKKGLARTALLARERLEGKKVYIVPMGLDYQDYYRLQTPVTIRFGAPIDVGAFLDAHPGITEAEVYRLLLSDLRERMSRLITYLPDDELYDGRWALTKIAGQEAAMAAGEPLITEAATFDRERARRHLSMWSFGHRRPVLRTIGRLLTAILFLPLFLYWAVMAAPMWLLSAYLVHSLKDKAFGRSARFLVKWLMTPLMVIVWALVFFLCLPAGHALVAFLVALPSHRLFYGLLNQGRILLSDLRLLFGHKDLKQQYAHLAAQARSLRTI